MKTKLNKPTQRPPGSLAFWSITIFLTVLCASAQAAPEGDDGECPPCKATARRVRQSALSEAQADYWLALARASTLPNVNERKAAIKQAGEERKENAASAAERYQARLTLCQRLGETRYHPAINPADFLSPAEVVAHPNPYFPLKPGTLFRYVGQTDEGTETNEVTVTSQTKEILGVTCMVVIDVVYLNGELAEYTWDWYAQDRHSNVWYFGELTLSYANGQIAGIEGSWEAGIEGGKPGIIMKHNPQVGDIYRQEFSPGLVEDAARVEARSQSVTVPFGSFTQCLKTSEFTPIEPESLQSFDHKFYAPGIGLVLETTSSGRRHELVAIETQ